MTGLLAKNGARDGSGLALRTEDRMVPVREPELRDASGYIRLASHVLLKAQKQDLRTLGVISPFAGASRSTAVLNLAACLGRTQGCSGRILVVDGDAKERTLSRHLTEATPTTQGTPMRSLGPTLIMTAFRGVDLMTAPECTDGGVLCSPTTWKQALEALAQRYAYIIVDCPPVLSSPDGAVLPSCVQELILVLQADHASRDAVRATLTTIGRPILAVVLNEAAR